MKMKKYELRKIEKDKRVSFIKNFAKEMGYTINESKYSHNQNKRPCYSIELIGTFDSEGNPYAWAWYLDTYEEF